MRDGANSKWAPLVIGVICLGWLFSLGVGSIQQNWTPLTIITPALLLAAGYVFGIQITRPEPPGEHREADKDHESEGGIE